MTRFSSFTNAELATLQRIAGQDTTREARALYLEICRAMERHETIAPSAELWAAARRAG